MDLQKAIRSRRTIHFFNTKKVSEEFILRAIEAANLAPCHHHTFPWRFMDVHPNERKLLLQLLIDLNFNSRPIGENLKEKSIMKFTNPSHLIVASQIISTNSQRRLEDYAACSCAIQNLSLSLTGDGVGSKWSTGQITKHKETYKILAINPKEEEIIGFIWIGYGEAPPPIKRPLITSVFRKR